MPDHIVEQPEEVHVEESVPSEDPQQEQADAKDMEADQQSFSQAGQTCLPQGEHLVKRFRGGCNEH